MSGVKFVLGESIFLKMTEWKMSMFIGKYTFIIP